MGPEMIAGSFCVSITAAMGIPKLETGPQKSVYTVINQFDILFKEQLVLAGFVVMMVVFR